MKSGLLGSEGAPKERSRAVLGLSKEVLRGSEPFKLQAVVRRPLKGACRAISSFG